MNRTDIINNLIENFGYKTYLEIGVRDCRSNFNKINCDIKTGVDPDPLNTPIDHVISIQTSDDFFKSNMLKYDIVFIDGLHEYQQALRDITNSLMFLKPGGSIVVHDCNPPTEWHQRDAIEYDGGGAWNGTVWKAFVDKRSDRHLSMYVIDCDWGVGVIQKGAQSPIVVQEEDLTYANLDINRRDWLNLRPAV
jgi:hypothetical protein